MNHLFIRWFFLLKSKKVDYNHSLFINFAKNIFMKYFILISLVTTILFSCNSNKTSIEKNNATEISVVKNDTIHIANDELEYEIIIIEPSFNAWLVTQPPMGHYGITFLESRNRRFVLSYNDKVYNDKSRKLYEQEIIYNTTTHYGLEVNYLLYNYFLYFQKTYNQKL